MKGRAQFTPEETTQIRVLLHRKASASSPEQKRLRDELRAIGFYVTDWSSSAAGFTRSDFDQLITDGRLTVVGKQRSTPGVRGLEERPGSIRELRREAARKYRPSKVTTLLIAEAPPAAEDRYFYFEDVREQDSLFRYVARSALGVQPTRENKGDLLARLCDAGYFLIDLQLDPRDGTPLATFVPDLIVRATELAPDKIILIKASVYDAAFVALHHAGLPVVDERVPFPGSGQQRNFERTFARALANG